MHWDKGSPFCTWWFFKGHCTLNYENKKCMAGISLSDILCAINILITWFLTVSTLLAFGNVTLSFIMLILHKMLPRDVKIFQ